MYNFLFFNEPSVKLTPPHDLEHRSQFSFIGIPLQTELSDYYLSYFFCKLRTSVIFLHSATSNWNGICVNLWKQKEKEGDRGKRRMGGCNGSARSPAAEAEFDALIGMWS